MDFVGIDTFSLLDYDGYISIVLFAPGCNFKCPYCHNYKNIVLGENKLDFNKILDYLKTRTNKVDAIVISGGEPTLMPDLIEKIKAIKKLGYKIKLDTNGTNPELLSQLINDNLIDYVAMDIKNSLNKYDITVGTKANKEAILKSIQILKSNCIDYEFRTTLVNEYFDNKSIKELGELINGANLLYLQKFVLRDDILNKDLTEVDIEKALQFKAILEKYIRKVDLRGY